MAIHYLECAALTPLSAAKKLALMAIADDADKATRVGACGLDAIRAWSGLGKSQALAVIAELVRDGYLVRRSAGRIGRKAEFVVFPAGCCPLHGPVPGYHPAGSDQPDPQRNTKAVGTPVHSPVHILGTVATAGSGQPDPAREEGPEEGPIQGPAAAGPLPIPLSNNPPTPQRAGGPDDACNTITQPHPRCRECGTTPRQIAAADRKRRAGVRHRCTVHGAAGWTDDGTCRGCAADRKAAS